MYQLILHKLPALLLLNEERDAEKDRHEGGLTQRCVCARARE